MTDQPRAILFDFGGVILSSPLDAFRAHEENAGLPARFLQKLNTVNPDTNAWACAERGEIDEAEFVRRFEAEARSHGFELDVRSVLGQLTGQVRPEMVDVLRRLKPRYRLACLTNNMKIGIGSAMSSDAALAAEIAEVMKLFEVVVESSKIGARKPEPRFYGVACELLKVAPRECVFLDDLGQNLKTARALGMRTIKVTTAEQAITELETILGHSVRGLGSQVSI